MGPYYYVVERISGDYGFLKRTDIEDNDLLQVAMALLPSDIDEGTKTKMGKPSLYCYWLTLISYIKYHYTYIPCI